MFLGQRVLQTRLCSLYSRQIILRRAPLMNCIHLFRKHRDGWAAVTQPLTPAVLQLLPLYKPHHDHEGGHWSTSLLFLPTDSPFPGGLPSCYFGELPKLLTWSLLFQYFGWLPVAYKMTLQYLSKAIDNFTPNLAVHAHLWSFLYNKLWAPGGKKSHSSIHPCITLQSIHQLKETSCVPGTINWWVKSSIIPILKLRRWALMK